MRATILAFAMILIVVSWAMAAGFSCSRCGAITPEKASHCPVCGYPVVGTTAGDRAATPATPATPTPESPAPSARLAASPSPRPVAAPSPRPTTRPAPGPAPAPSSRVGRPAPSPAPAPRPAATESKPVPTSEPDPPERPGFVVIELVYRGDRTMATSFGVRVDGGLEAQGQSQPSRIASDLVRTYRFERAVRSGRHHLKVTMMGVRSDRRDGTMEEDDKEFDVTISPGETARIYHEWTDGIEEFAKTQPCCQRNHTRP